MSTQPRNHHRERELPMLAAIAGMLRWVEELANIAAGPLLTAGLAIALVDLLTDGRLLASQPALLYAWAVSQAVGVDAQLVGSAAKAAAAMRARRPWVVVGYLLLVALLAYVGFVAAQVFATQEAEGLTTAAALARLGMDSTSWIVQRSALAVLLVVLSGFLRYVPPSAAIAAEDERAQLQRELELEPLRAQLRARKALGWRNVAGAITQGTAASAPLALPTPAQDGASAPQNGQTVDASSVPSQATPAPAQRDGEPPHPRPPTGPGSPAIVPVRTRRRESAAAIRLQAPPEWRQTAARASARGAHTRPGRTAEEKARSVWQSGMSVTQLERAAGISRSTAHKWRRILMAEATQHSASVSAASREQQHEGEGGAAL